MRVFDGAAGLAGAVGRELGACGWRELTQAEITAFAEATGDRQWIHVDPGRAADGPFGGPIAHGFYLLSLLPALLSEVFTISGVGAVVNLGVDDVRFHRPVRVGARFRYVARLDAVEVRRRGVADVTLSVRLEVADVAGPALTATLHQMVRPPRRAPQAAESCQRETATTR
jgi:acyl dehydratase